MRSFRARLIARPCRPKINSVSWPHNKGRRGRMLEVGATAPEFEVNDHTGATVRLSDYRGRKVLL